MPTPVSLSAHIAAFTSGPILGSYVGLSEQQKKIRLTQITLVLDYMTGGCADAIMLHGAGESRTERNIRMMFNAARLIPTKVAHDVALNLLSLVTGDGECGLSLLKKRGWNVGKDMYSTAYAWRRHAGGSFHVYESAAGGGRPRAGCHGAIADRWMQIAVPLRKKGAQQDMKQVIGPYAPHVSQMRQQAGYVRLLSPNPGDPTRACCPAIAMSPAHGGGYRAACRYQVVVAVVTVVVAVVVGAEVAREVDGGTE